MTTDDRLLADLYDAAADYIERHGWYQGNLYPGSNDYAAYRDIKAYIAEHRPPVCAMGAGYGAMTMPQFASIVGIADYHRTLQAEIDGSNVADWNDCPHRTKEDVINLLRMTALKIRMGNIGDNPREYEFEPMPTTEPVKEPAAPQPIKEPERVG